MSGKIRTIGNPTIQGCKHTIYIYTHVMLYNKRIRVTNISSFEIYCIRIHTYYVREYVRNYRKGEGNSGAT